MTNNMSLLDELCLDTHPGKAVEMTDSLAEEVQLAYERISITYGHQYIFVD